MYEIYGMPCLTETIKQVIGVHLLSHTFCLLLPIPSMFPSTQALPFPFHFLLYHLLPFLFFLIIITHWEERRTAANAGPCLISSLCCALLLPLVAPLFWPFPLSFFLQLLLAFLEVFVYWKNLYWYFQNNISLFFYDWLTLLKRCFS